MPESHPANTALAKRMVTLLFTDIEGSTVLWEQDGARMSQALAAHDALARRVVESRHGTVVKMTGDGMHAAFDDALDALEATVDLQQALADLTATHEVALRVRCGLHAGVVERRDNDYFGSPVNRAARIMSAAHGGQVLLSQAVVEGVRDRLTRGIALRDLGSVRLKDLSSPEHVYQVMHPQLRQNFPALRSLEATPNNLPQQATSFIGRHKELADVRSLLERAHTLSLTGSGGCGKTRLSLQIAADTLERFPDGAWLVELAPLADPDLVPQTVATVLGLKEVPGKSISQTLSGHLKDKRLLLLLDNCEHLLDGCAQLVDALVRQCPDVQILASSREALGIGGEHVYRVPSMSLPNQKQPKTPAYVSEFEAVQLFAERASLVCPDFQITEGNASALASICQRLDGIPLAIELAAARLSSLTAAEVDDRLDQRFRLLTGGSRTALPRQRTLRALIDWSYSLLREPERRLLQRLTVFAGGWTLEAAEKVCADDDLDERLVCELLSALVDKSLVVVEQLNRHSRYRLLETVRQFGQEQLLEGDGVAALRTRHRDYFLESAELAFTHLAVGADQVEWLNRLESDRENLRAALEWSLTCAGSEEGLRLCGAMRPLWNMRGYYVEGRHWCARALGKAGADRRTAVRANALATAGGLALGQSDYLASEEAANESLDISRELNHRNYIANALNILGLVACDRGRFALANTLHEEGLSIKRELHDEYGVAALLNSMGNTLFAESEYASAKELYVESLALRRQIGDIWGISASLLNLGAVEFEQGNLLSARALYEECLAIARALDHRSGIADVLNSLGELAQKQEDYPSALRLYLESIFIRNELGDRGITVFTLVAMAEVLAAVGKFVNAARIWGLAERMQKEVGSYWSPSELAQYSERLAAARMAIEDGAAFDKAWLEGNTITLAQAMVLVPE